MTTDTAPHPVTLESLVFTKCLVEAVSGHVQEENKSSFPPDNHLEVKAIPDQPRHWAAMMRTVVNADKDPKSPYYIEMQCAALFKTDETLDEKTARRGVTITAHSVIYGAIRETVAWLTGRQPYGPLLLGLSVLRSPNQPTPPAHKVDV